LENSSEGILNLNVEKLSNEYCSSSFEEIPLSKFENMFNDFKIMLKLVEVLKNDFGESEKGFSHPQQITKKNGKNNI
jgi:hypothetical protein